MNFFRNFLARNVLYKDEDTVKLTDFGLAKHILTTMAYRPPPDDQTPRLVPKPEPPENYAEHGFTTATDVWFFAFFIWEVYTIHYTSKTETEVVREKSQLTNPGPTGTPGWLQPDQGKMQLINLGPAGVMVEEVQHIMLRCCALDPRLRLHAQIIARELKRILDSE